MDKITKIIRSVDDNNQDKVDWTKAWSDINKYSKEIRKMFNSLQEEYGYSELDSMLVLKDILAHEYLDNKK